MSILFPTVRAASRLDPDQTMRSVARRIWVYTVFSGLSVRIISVNIISIAQDARGYQDNNFLISARKHML